MHTFGAAAKLLVARCPPLNNMLPNKSDESISGKTALLDVLQEAAFVSADGRVCRLFDDTESENLAAFCVPEEPVSTNTCAVAEPPAVQGISLEEFDSLLSEPLPKKVTVRSSAALPETPQPRLIPVLQLFDENKTDDKAVAAKQPKNADIADEDIEPVIIPFVIKEAGCVRPETGDQKPKTGEDCIPPASCLPTPVSVPEVQVPPLTDAWSWSETLNGLNVTAENQIQALADHLVIQMNQGVKTIFFTGFLKGDGCTTLLQCAARELVNRSYHIFLADVNRKHSELPQLLGLPETFVRYDTALKLSDNLTFAVWKETAVFADVLSAEKPKHDLTLLDGGSLSEYPLSDHIQLWQDCDSDGNVLVINTKNTPESTITSISKRFKDNNVPLLGVAENCV